MIPEQYFIESRANGNVYLWEYANYSLILLGVYRRPARANQALDLAKVKMHPAQITGEVEYEMQPALTNLHRPHYPAHLHPAPYPN